MSQRNDYNYFDLDNFDESFDSRDYRRRQAQRRQESFNGRASYNVPRSGRRRSNKRRARRRIIIVIIGILIIVLTALLISAGIRTCSDSPDSVEGSATADTAQTVAETQAQEQTSAQAQEQTSAQAQDDLSPTYFITPEIEDNGKDGTAQYGIYFWQDAGYELFRGSDSGAENYAETVNNLAKKLDGMTVYDMIIPNHTEMGLPQRLKDKASSESQADNIKTAYSKLSDKVTAVNCYNYLAEHNDEYIYFNSDHHWTGLGAYYAYSAFAETNGLPVLPLKDCTEQKIEGFTGTFTNTDDSLSSDTVSYYELPYEVEMNITDKDGKVTSYDSPYYSYAASGGDTYGVFIVGDNPLTVMKSSSEKADGSRKIAVIKESYGNAFVPYLTYNYSEVHVIDFRYFEESFADYCKDNGITDVLFLNGVMSANTQTQLDSISAMFD